VLSLSNLIN